MFSKNKFLIALIWLCQVVQAQPLEEMRAVKITNVDSDVMFSDRKISEAMDYLASIGINTIIPVVWNGNSADGVHTLYPSKVMERYFDATRRIHPRMVGRDPLQTIIIEAHRNGMEVLPWFEMGFSPSYSQKGGYILKRYPHWALHGTNGQLLVKNGFDWMSAIHPEVQQFIYDLTEEVVQHYDIDGIEYSDRIPALPVEGGYEPETVTLYQNEHNGTLPPINPRDSAWMRWRADKLNAWFQRVNNMVKANSISLKVAASPSLYPWGYMEYLQDAENWLRTGIADELIPQLYRYNINDYVYELNQAVNYAGVKKNLLFAGVLARVGSYTITPTFLSESIKANRQRGVNGEVYFFYEALRANQNELGQWLKTQHYTKPALVPERNKRVWRPKADVLQEDDANVQTTGTWTITAQDGFRGKGLLGTQNATKIYPFKPVFNGSFDLYAFLTPDPNYSPKAQYILSQSGKTTTFLYDQSKGGSGWQKIGEINADANVAFQITLKSEDGKPIFADALMLMLNRKRSPNTIVANEANETKKPLPQNETMLQNFPNPFNENTQFQFTLSEASAVKIALYDLLGREVQVVANRLFPSGKHTLSFEAQNLPSGVYLAKMETAQETFLRRINVLR